MSRPDVIERSVLVAERNSFRGPLPEPSDYAEYGQVEPTAPERILAQWEAESRHRRAYEMKAFEGSLTLAAAGLRNALMFSVAALSAAVAAMYFNMPAVAATIGGGTIVAGIGAFVYRQKAADQKRVPPRTRMVSPDPRLKRVDPTSSRADPRHGSARPRLDAVGQAPFRLSMTG